MNFVDRRTILIVAGLLAGLPLSTRSQSEASGPYADHAKAVSWMDAVIDSAGSVSGALFFGKFKDRTYYLLKPISWAPEPAQKQLGKVTAPKGFVTDLTSIPRAFWSLLPPDGPYAHAAILHDFLYWEQPIPREDADLVLKYAMEELSIDAATVSAIYAGVRVGGGGPWDANRKAKASGERRILAKFPDSPQTTFDEFRKGAGVFK